MRRGRLALLLAGLIVLSGATTVARAACLQMEPSLSVPTAVVLSGGGAKGAWEAGVVAALADAGVPIAVAAGSSAGALTATMLADGRIERMLDLWRGLSRERVYRLRPGAVFAGLLPGWLATPLIGRMTSVLDPSPLEELIGASLDLDRVRRSSVRLIVVATDLVSRRARVFDNASLTLRALMAVSALPGLFPPVELDGAALADGGLVARAPVIEALEAGAGVGRVIVVVSYGAGERGRQPTSLRVALEEAFETTMLHQIRRDVELARLKYPAIDTRVIEPSAALALRPLDFEPEKLAAAIERGRSDGRQCVHAWRGALPRD